MVVSAKHGWITEHRRWEDVTSALLGVVIVFSPDLAGADVAPIVFISAGLVGVVITILALLELMLLQQWEEVLELVCGAWVVASPLVLNYGGALRAWHFVLGGVVFALALLGLWQDRNRSSQDNGWHCHVNRDWPQ